MGWQNERLCQNSHRFLNRARGLRRGLSQFLLRLPGQLFVPADAPIVVGSDETIERRRGARDLSHDPG